MKNHTYLVTLALAAALAMGCGTGDEDGSGGGRGGGSGTGGFGNATGGMDGAAARDFGNGNGGGNGGGTGTGGMFVDPGGQNVTVTGSYIWIANTVPGTVSKINTETMMEEGRYLTSPAGDGRPSRTSVSSSGSVAVANRGFAADLGSAGGTEAGITKILNGVCPDQNNDGTVQTSTGGTDVLPWGQDECVVWHRSLPWTSNRAVAWAPNSAPDGPEVLWTAGVAMGETCLDGGCNFTVLQLDSDTGDTTVEVKVTGLSGVNMLTAGGQAGSAGGALAGGFIGNYGPYGGAADAGGNFWIFNAQTTDLVYIPGGDPQNYRVWPTDMANGYGITIDPKGNVFVCGHFGVSKFTPSTETWVTNGMGPQGGVGYSGCMTDGGDFIWVGGGVDEGAAGLHQYRADDVSYVKSFNVGPVKGVSIDVNGNIWGTAGAGALGANAAGANIAYRVDPNTGNAQTFDQLEFAYSYSDMTGFGLEAAGWDPVEPQ